MLLTIQLGPLLGTFENYAPALTYGLFCSLTKYFVNLSSQVEQILRLITQLEIHMLCEVCHDHRHS